jgi:2-isopropylmalate synthase
LPWEFGQLVAEVKKEFPTIRISAHCHNDLGLAVANALEGLRNGAERVDTCINGLGERAGNAASEEVVMAIKTRSANLGMDVKVDTRKIASTSRLVARLSGMQVQWTKPVVGQNVFSHGGGIHQDGVLKDASTYEIMTPESVGLTAADRRMHMGKLSGRAALDAQLRELGYELEKEQLNRAFDMAKLLLGKKKELEEMDMRYIAETSITTTVVEFEKV